LPEILGGQTQANRQGKDVDGFRGVVFEKMRP
jgi:hypothetical protein